MEVVLQNKVTEILDYITKKSNKICTIKEAISGGWINLKWRADYGRNDIIIKELASERYSENRIKNIVKSLDVQNKLSKLYGIAPCFFLLDDKLVNCVNGNHFTMMAYVEGEHLNIDSINDDQLFNLGHALGQLHNFSSNNDCFTGIVDDHIDNFDRHLEKLDQEKQLEDHSLTPLVLKAHEIRKSVDKSFFKDCKVGFTHADFSKDNILFSGSQVKILDFDRGKIDYQLQDIGRGIMTFAFDGKSINLKKLKSFIKGYQSISCLSTSDVYKALRLTWLIEVPYWFHYVDYEKKVKDKLREFRDEITWLTHHWQGLEMVLKVEELLS